jgi:hypothetical protein
MSVVIISKLFKAIILLVNALYVQFANRAVLMIIVAVLIFYSIWLVRDGYRQYIHRLPVWGSHMYSAAYLASGFALTAQLVERPRKFGDAAIDVLVLFIIILCFLRVVCRLKPRFKVKKINKEAIKALEYMMHADESSLERNGSNNQVLVAGLLRLHELAPCENPHCFTHSSSLKQHFESTNHGGSTLNNAFRLRLLLKCLYESKIVNHPTDSELLIDYLEFLLNELKSEHLSCELIFRLHTLKLGFFERIKV